MLASEERGRKIERSGKVASGVLVIACYFNWIVVTPICSNGEIQAVQLWWYPVMCVILQ